MLAVSQQPATWPRIWSTEGEVDLQDRLSRLPFYAPNGFGGVAEDIQTIIAKGPDLLQKAVGILNSAGPNLDTIMQAVQDPALPQLIDRVKTLKALEDAKPPKSGTPSTAGAPGIGLDRVLPIWDAAIFLDKHPVAQFVVDHPVLVGAGTFLAIVGIGIGVGRLTKRCRIPKPSKAVGRRSRRR